MALSLATCQRVEREARDIMEGFSSNMDWLRKEANGGAFWTERAEAAFAKGPDAVQAEVNAWQAEFGSSPAGRSKPPGVPVSTATDDDEGSGMGSGGRTASPVRPLALTSPPAAARTNGGWRRLAEAEKEYTPDDDDRSRPGNHSEVSRESIPITSDDSLMRDPPL